MKAGSIGDIGSFSFQLSKLMTAGEGGALTTSDPELCEKLDALRNCGRRPEPEAAADKGEGIYGDEGNFIQSGNYRMTDFQAALLTESLRRLPRAQQGARRRTPRTSTRSSAKLPGVQPMRRDNRETAEAYYNFSFRYNREQFKGVPVTRFREALAAEIGLQRRGQLPAAQCVLAVRPAHQALAVQADGAALETDRPAPVQAAGLRPDPRRAVRVPPLHRS